MNAESSLSPVPSPSSRYPLTIAGWFAAALAVGASGVLASPPRFAPAALILSLTAAQIVAYRRSEGFAAWARGLDARVLFGLHALRLPIGASFLVMMQRGELPSLFAERAGYGDIVAGLLALPLVLSGSLSRKRGLLLAVNAFGFADIVMVFLTAQWLMVQRDALMLSTLTRLPWVLLPLFVVPVVMSTHLLVFARLLRGETSRH